MRVYAYLVASLIACRLVLHCARVDFQTAGQRLMLEWWFLALLAVYGAIGVSLLRRTGFPGVGTSRRGVVVAAVHGVPIGVATIVIDLLRPVPAAHQPLPEGILLYWYGGVISEIWFHLLPVPLFVFAASNLLSRGRHHEPIFWLAAGVLSFWEGRRFLTQLELWNVLDAAAAFVTYAANLSEIWLFRRFGFMAAIMQRMASYALWHVLWPWLRG